MGVRNRYAELAHVVRQMRAAQVTYFKTRTSSNLSDAKRLESIVDRLIADEPAPAPRFKFLDFRLHQNIVYRMDGEEIAGRIVELHPGLEGFHVEWTGGNRSWIRGEDPNIVAGDIRAPFVS